ncbi:MAG TPA: hypothetical protein VF546_05720 [Pyrinomonadaceae bacterium]|jgi:hypothetical protein
MLKRAGICIATLSFLVIIGLPIAQAQGTKTMTAQVPFDFYVRDRVLPAGTYEVTALSADGALLRISRVDGDDAVSVITNSAQADRRHEASARLIFRRYDDQYFLAAAWRDADNGRELSRTSRERSLVKERALAARATRPEVVTVAATFGDN